MNRLTRKKRHKVCDGGKHPTAYTSGHTFQEVVARLAAYEDTGLTPEDVTDLQRAWDMYGGEEGITALAEKAKASPPANDPLTPEDLREMGGEPVWIVWEGGVDRYALIRYQTHYGVMTYGCGFLPWELLGNGWDAYRRRPEESAI